MSCEDPGFDGNAAIDHCGIPAAAIDAASLPLHPARGLQSELVSENATRSIFGWLRMDGYPPTEKDIFTHEWFDVGSSSEESEVSEEDSSSDNKHGVVNEWLDKVNS
jgi:hypothetical protein